MVSKIPDDWWLPAMEHNSEENYGEDCIQIDVCPYIHRDGTRCGKPGCLGPWKAIEESGPNMHVLQLITNIVRSYQRNNGNILAVANEVFIVFQFDRVLHSHRLKSKEAQGRNTSHIIPETLRRCSINEYEVVTRVTQERKIPSDKLEDMGAL